MGRMVVRFRDGGVVRWGQLTSRAPTRPEDVLGVTPFAADMSTTAEVIAAADRGALMTEPEIRISAAQLLSPVTLDATIFAQGLNYESHASEAQHAKRKSNLIFSKASSSLTGAYNDIVRPAEVQLLDYEVEFGIVLRRRLGEGDEVTDETLGQAVAGIVLCNDVSARDTMFGTTFLQWYRGKSYRTFCPCGPVLWLLDPGEAKAALEGLELQLSVNGEERQAASSQQLIWKPAETLSYIASTIDLKPGDLLLTGTPGGVTAPATPRMVDILKTHLLADDVRRDELRVEMTAGRPFLKPGDVVTATLVQAGGQSLGGLANTVADPA